MSTAYSSAEQRRSFMERMERVEIDAQRTLLQTGVTLWGNGMPAIDMAAQKEHMRDMAKINLETAKARNDESLRYASAVLAMAQASQAAKVESIMQEAETFRGSIPNAN